MPGSHLVDLPLTEGPHQIGDDVIFQWLVNRQIASVRLMSVARQALDDCAVVFDAVMATATARPPLLMADLRTDRVALTPFLKRRIEAMRRLAALRKLDYKLAIVLCDGNKRKWFLNAAHLFIATVPGAYEEQVFHYPQDAVAWLKSFIPTL